MKTRIIFFIVTFVTFIYSCNDESSTSKNEHKDSTSVSGGHSTTDSINHSNSLMASMRTMMDSMKAVKMTKDFDVDFANMMIAHHNGAIAMSNIEVTNGKDEKLKKMAQKIIDAQTEEIKHLNNFLRSYKGSGMIHGEGELSKSMSNMEAKMNGMQMTRKLDEDFATMMIAHHEAAVEMAKLQLSNGMNDKLKELAQKTITEQTKEIQELKSRLANNS